MTTETAKESLLSAYRQFEMQRSALVIRFRDRDTGKIHRVERVWCDGCERSVRVWVSLPQWYARTWVTPTGQCPDCKVHLRYTPPRGEAVVWHSRRDA